MSKISRRAAIQQVSAGALAAATLSTTGWSESMPPPEANSADPLPRALALPGFHAYAEGHSVVAGQPIQFFVSSTVPYEFSIVRLGIHVDDPAQDETVQELPRCEPADQPIRPGSCVKIARGLTAQEVAKGVALEGWFRLFRIDTAQGLLTQQAADPGFGLALSGTGEVLFRCGQTVVGPQLQRMRWQHVVAQWDGRTSSLWLDGERVAEVVATNPPRLSPAPLLLGAVQVDGELQQFLEGDVAQPAIYRRALTADEIRARFESRGLTPPRDEQLLGSWPLQEERGTTVADVSRGGRTGQIVNGGTWMIGGPSFRGDQVPRYGSTYDPAADAERGHGLRLAADDLYDCGWKPTHTWQVPATARSGLYAARARFELDGKPMTYHVTFVVRRGPQQPQAPLVVLCSTNTWLAYNSAPFTVNRPNGTYWYVSTEGGPNSHPDAPAYSMYRSHRSGQPTYQLGLRMPWPVAGPDVWYSPPDTGYSHLMRGERFTHAWLEQNGYAFDVITDLDLHRDPNLLNGYRALLINGHSEYWSSEAYEGVDRYLRGGGNAIVFSGNTMFWRVSISPDGRIMECRKFDERIGGRPTATIGELFHSHDGKRGSLLRECGQPAWQVVGLECDGWGGNDREGIGIYVTETPDHFLFREPELVGLQRDETFGHAPGGGVPKAIGHEWDVRVGRLTAITKNVPAGAALPEEPAGIVTLARGVRKDTHALDYFTQPTTAPDGTVAEMIYWERPQGGRVFHGGAIAVGWALSADPKLQALVRNVLHHFGVPRP